VRTINRLELGLETLHAALNRLAVVAPDWLRPQIQPDWLERYGRRAENSRLPKADTARQALAAQVGVDGYALLTAVYAPDPPLPVRTEPAVEVLRQVWVQQYYGSPNPTVEPEPSPTVAPPTPTPRTTRVSVASDGTPANDDSFSPATSADGRYVAFTSAASNLVASDTNQSDDVFVHDRQTGQTTLVSVASDGTPANDDSGSPAISMLGLPLSGGAGALDPNYRQRRIARKYIGSGQVEKAHDVLVARRQKGRGMHGRQETSDAVAALRTLMLNGGWDR